MSQMLADLQGYFRKLLPPREDLLLDLEKEAERERIPIIGPVVGELIALLARVSGARRILELGTATGYSAVHLGRVCRELGGRLVTLEHDPAMTRRALANLRKAGLQPWIEIRPGDAVQLMAAMDESFDLIFMDIDKEFYAPALPHCRRLLRVGGLLVTDNVGFAAADAFNRLILSSKEWRTVHLLSFLPGHSPEEDALCLALRVE